MTVAASTKVDGVGAFRKVSAINDYDSNVEPVGTRTATSILAPGVQLDLVGPNGNIPTPPNNSGTSFAAPHVTGTVALLQEFGDQQIGVGTPQWTPNARRHEVMKAVLMNSADKVIDNGSFILPGETLPVLPGKLLGMTRTVEKTTTTGGVFDDWFDSPAHSNPNIPLDLEMGAGHLNAKRALEQFSPGEYDAPFFGGTVNVPAIGWDYSGVDDPGTINKYLFDTDLQQGSYVSATLVWDREVVLEFDDGANLDEYDAGETFVDFGFEDLNLHLLPQGATTTAQAIWSSTSSVMNLEHLFAEIPATGAYELWVELNNPGLFANARYALAWWAKSVQSAVSMGDFDGDGFVNQGDYDAWKTAFGMAVSPGTGADGNGNGVIDAADYTVWLDNLGATISGSAVASETAALVPEPSTLGLLFVTLVGSLLATRCGRRPS